MFSNSIEIHSRECKQHSDKVKTKTPAPFTKKEKSKIPQDLENEALEAIKEMLSRHKQSNDVASLAHILPLSETTSSPTEHSLTTVKVESSVQWAHLFNKLVKELISTHQSGIQETTIFLGQEDFSSSIFSGSQITITEFSTAPKVFNIQFQGGQKALTLFEAHAADLAKVLNQGKFGFLIGRIDAGFLKDSHQKYKVSAIERDLEEEENNDA